MLKNKMKAVQLSALALAVTGAMGTTQAVAEVDVSASVAISNLYLFRGIDLGEGRAMVSGDLIASSNGFYGGVWATSGDKASGSEYDLFVGYATEIEGVSVDINITNYMYSGWDAGDSFGDYSEIYSINGKKISMIHETEISKIDWKKYKVDVVLECTGIFTSKEKAQQHITAGAKKVLISAPASGVDLTVVYGVNHKKISSEHQILSNASCTTNCLAPLVKVIHENLTIYF